MSTSYNSITNLFEIDLDVLNTDTANINNALIQNLDANVGNINTFTSTTSTITNAGITNLTSTNGSITNFKTNSIEPLVNANPVVLYSNQTSSCSIGNSLNANPIVFNQDIEVDNIEVDTATVNTQLNTNIIKPLGFNDNLIIGDNFWTGYIGIEQDIISNANITTNNVNANNQLFTNLITANTSIDNLVIGDNTWTGIIDIQQDVDINGDLEADNITINTNFKTNSIEPKTNANPVVLYSAQTNSCSIGNLSNTTNPIRFNQNVSIGTNTNTRQLNVSNEQNTANNNYLQLLNTNYTSRENGIHIRNQNAGVFQNEWYIYTPANNTGLRFFNVSDRFTFSNVGALSLASLSATGNVASAGQIQCIGGANNQVICGTFNTNGTTASLFGNNTTLAITLGNGLTTANLNLMAQNATTGNVVIGTATQTGRVLIRCNLDVGADATQKGITCAYYQAYAVGNLVRLFPTSTTGDIRLGEAQTNGSIQIGHTTPASDLGTLNINKNTVIATGKSLTFSTTSDLKVNSIQPINVGDTTNLMTTSTAQINIGNPASASALAISNTISMASGKNIYLANTTSRIECNNFESFTNSNPVEMYRLLTGSFKIGNLANTNRVEFYQDIDLSTSNKALYVNGISTIDPTQFLVIGQDSDTSYIQIERNTYIYTGKTLFSDTQRATAGAGGTVNLYNDITTGSINFGTGQTSADINIGNLSATTGLILLGTNTTIPSTKSLTLTTITGSTVSSVINLFNNITTGSINLGTGQTTGSINIGNVSASTGLINLNNNVVIPSTESLAVTTINSNGTGLSLSLGNNIINNNVNIGSSINIGSINLGNTSASNCQVNINNDMIFSSGKNLTLDSSSKISTDNIEAYATLPLTIGNNNTTSAISMGTGLTTGNLILGGAGTSGRIIIGNQSATPSAGNGHLTLYNKIHNPFSGGAHFFNVNSSTNLFTTSALSGKQLTTSMYASAPTDNFSVWESNAKDEACFIAQNGDTTIISNPGDQSALWYLDEDNITSANNWAWVGFKMATNGVITASSDRRIKRDIQPVVKTGLLDKLENIEFVNYKMKPPREDIDIERRKYKEVRMGCIAQDVRNYLPEVVDRENNDSFFTIKYSELDMFFHMGVQELIRENKELKERVNQLEEFLKSKYPDYI
jgi:hypothetical protein